MSDFDTERLIVEMESRPALWDCRSEDYRNNRFLRNKLWDEVCEVFYPGFDGLKDADKVNKCKTLHRRWRSLRDCYARELNTQRKVKSGSEPPKKQYKYFKHLNFLRPSLQKRRGYLNLDDDSLEVNDTESGDIDIGEDSTGMQELHIKAEILDRESTPEVCYDDHPVSSRKRSHDHLSVPEMTLMQDISQRFSHRPAKVPTLSQDPEDDEDRMFLLSLLKDVKRVHEDDRLVLKSEILLLVRKWQLARSANVV